MEKMLQQNRSTQSGNIFFYVLLGIALIAMLVAALRRDDGLTGSVDNEAASVKANQILDYGNQLAQAVKTLLANGVSETDIRFAYPDADPGYGTITTNPTFQVFSTQGGGARYRPAPANSNNGYPWNFYPDYKLPQVGSDKADLIAMLPFVTDAVCKAINTRLGLPTTLTASGCGATTYFVGVFPSSPTAITVTPAQTVPMLQACVTCAGGNLYYTTLIAR